MVLTVYFYTTATTGLFLACADLFRPFLHTATTGLTGLFLAGLFLACADLSLEEVSLCLQSREVVVESLALLGDGDALALETHQIPCLRGRDGRRG